MEEKTRVAVVAIIIEDTAAAEKVNGCLHGFGDFIIGRMGLPYKSRGVSVISVIVDAPIGIINSLTGKLGMIPSVNAKALFSNV